jgi:hypothetical protein
MLSLFSLYGWYLRATLDDCYARLHRELSRAFHWQELSTGHSPFDSQRSPLSHWRSAQTWKLITERLNRDNPRDYRVQWSSVYPRGRCSAVRRISWQPWPDIRRWLVFRRQFPRFPRTRSPASRWRPYHITEAGGVRVIERIIGHVAIKIRIASCEFKRVLRDKPLKSGAVVSSAIEIESRGVVFTAGELVGAALIPCSFEKEAEKISRRR